MVTLRLEWMCLSLCTWTDRLCSQREQHSPVDTEKDADRFSAAAWWTMKKQGTGPEHSTKTQNNIYFSSPNQTKTQQTTKMSFKAKQQMFIRKSVCKSTRCKAWCTIISLQKTLIHPLRLYQITLCLLCVVLKHHLWRSCTDNTDSWKRMIFIKISVCVHLKNSSHIHPGWH